MNKKLLALGCVLTFAAIFAAPAPAGAVTCMIINGQQLCENTDATQVGGPTQTTSQTTAPVPSGFGSQGLFDCNADGAYSVSKAAMGAVGGSSYVPVNDAAVTLTTGYLVYKECVLSKMAANMRKAATAQLIQDTTTQFLTGRNGGPMFSQNLPQELSDASDIVVANALNGGQLNKINPAFQNDVKTAVYRSYYQQTRDPASTLACSYGGSSSQLSAILRGQGTNGAADILVLTDPNCDPLRAAINANSVVMSDVAARQNDILTRLSWSGGVYDIVNQNGTVLTPGFIVAGMIQQQLGSSFRQQESATDINQMLDYTFRNISNQILNAGLAGLVQRIGGQPSYLSRVVQETSSGLQNAAANTGLQILITAQQNETQYLAAWNAVASAKIQATIQFRAAENACWNAIVPKVQQYAAGGCAASTGGATCPGPFGIRIATSTVFSQAAIASSPLFASASTTANEINGSTSRLNILNQLLVDATNPASTTAQQTALQQIDTLVTGGTLRNQYQVQAAQKQASDAQTAMTNLLTNTVKHWGDDPLSATDSTSGWCNVNNQDVIRMWAERWKI